ncbi:MAG: SurA N-terminal domain-containing protein, partial [Acidobacteriota bacterium]|nr:SurA N-terminal domain-containing protein [Acidobacteriota bacterium]
MNRFLLSLAAGAAIFGLSACKHSPPANVAAEVNGHAITYAELDKAYQSNYAQQGEGASEDQVMAQKLDLLNSLINNEIMMQRAEKLGLNATDSDVDAEIAKMRSPYTKEEFEKQLADRHMTVDDLRAQKRR